MRTLIAIALVAGIVASGRAQAPSTQAQAPGQASTVTTNEKGQSIVTNLVLKLENGWQLKADRATVVTPGLTIQNPGGKIYIPVQVKDQKAPTELDLTGNVRLTMVP